jgi:hypothetical protein
LVFRIAYTTLKRPKLEGGWGLTDVEVKSRVLLYYWLHIQGGMDGTVTADWIEKWGLMKGWENPPDVRSIPAHLGYLRQYAVDLAYVRRRGDGETLKAFRKRIRTTLDTLLRDTVDPLLMRVARLWPRTNWMRVWRNIQSLPGTETMKIRWYQVVHDVVPTNARLRRINRSLTENCRPCGMVDTLHHRIVECGDGQEAWRWTRERIATILRIDSKYVPPHWLLRPDFDVWPPQRHRAILWMLAHLVIYRTQAGRALSFDDYMDFLRRSKCKTDS